MIQVFSVPNPAKGAEWVYTIPGQYDFNIIAVIATLFSQTDPTTAVDSSPGLNNATYSYANNTLTFNAAGPYGDGVNVVHQTAARTADTFIASGAGVAAFTSTTFTIGLWANTDVSAPNTTGTVFEVQKHPLAVHNDPYRYALGVNSGLVTAGLNNSNGTAGVGHADLGAWHHYAVSSDGTTIKYYRDGVLDATRTAAWSVTAGTYPFEIGGTPNEGETTPFVGSLTGVFWNASVLTQAQIAAYVTAAATSSTAYKTAVLADSPTALWMFTEQPTTFQRAANLQVTDGTHVVGRYPAFTPSQQSANFTWVWLTQGAQSVQTPDQSVTTVVIPDRKSVV